MVLPGKMVLDQGGSLAFIILQNGGTDIITIKPIVGKYFKTRYGDFQLNTHMRYSWGKKSLYFYYQGFPNPIDVDSVVSILKYIQTPGMNDPILRKADIENESARSALGYEALQFLEAFQFVDEDAIEHAFDLPLQTKKKSPVSSSLLALPSRTSSSVGLYVTKDRKVERVKIKIIHNEKGTFAKTKYGEFDIADKKTRYIHGKTSLYVFMEGYDKSLYLTVSTFLSAFLPHDPLTIKDVEEDIRQTNHAVQAALKRAEKKPMNIMLILIAIIGFVVVYQVVINPMIAKAQTDAERQKTVDNNLKAQQNSLEQQRLELEKQRLELNPQAPVITEK